MTPETLAHALRETATAIVCGYPADAVYVADHGVTIVTNPVSALRWRETFGDDIEGVDLHVVAAQPLGVSA